MTYPSPFEIISEQETIHEVEDVVMSLDERERSVIFDRCGFYGDKLTLERSVGLGPNAFVKLKARHCVSSDTLCSSAVWRRCSTSRCTMIKAIISTDC
jgi:hypothetical protein